MILRRTALAIAALVLALPGASLAKEQGHGPSGKHSKAHQSQTHRNQAHAPKPARPGPQRAKPCPPGLAKKHTGCLPPGQWRKGDRLPDSWAVQFIAYAALPDFFRSRYPVRSGHRYLYRDDRVFVVDAVTRVIVDVILP